jgi:hypothetical protein
MKVKVYIDKKFSHDFYPVGSWLPREKEIVKFGTKEYVVNKVNWRMKGDGSELLHASLYLS